jgi:putative membrane-bound dehydrogenase-like protein
MTTFVRENRRPTLPSNRGLMHVRELRRACLAVAAATLFCLCGAPFPAGAQGYAPEVAAAKMTAADSFAVDLVAAEPQVRQPVCIEFDDCGRLWVVQYLQYPNPAGLKRVKVDRYSRTVYDRIPEPPPRGPKGADRITILEDTDGDGRVDQSKDFVGGLNLATGMAFGYGGVFVLNVPYLLFYPDRNHDDIPDGDPEVLLAGFGMEDTSSLANSLTWGPDGWLYGTQGTNITAHIRGIDFEQGVWRYHPVTHEFELFCEGGGNSWGLDFDETGNLFYSTNYGGYLMVHGFEGAYYVKQFQKHGELHNPFAFGYFDHVPHTNFQGGHVTVGGTVYQEHLFPPEFRGRFIAADLLGHGVNWHTITRDGSTVRTAHGGSLLKANDGWFAPSDLTTGPDGAIYVADWCDKRTAHPDPDADWDRSNGRVYRIRPASTHSGLPASGSDLSAQTTTTLIDSLGIADGWHARRVLRLLYERHDLSVVPSLAARFDAARDRVVALRYLWALRASGGFDERLAERLLEDPREAIRKWTISFLGEDRHISAVIEDKLKRIGATDPSPVVRAQLASSAQRFPALCGLRIAATIAENPVSVNDRSIPLLVWWAVEKHATVDRSFTVRTFASNSAGGKALVRDVIIGRLLKRFAAEGTSAGFAAAAQIFESAPSKSEARHLLSELDEGLQMIGARTAQELPLGTSYLQFASVQTRQAPGRGKLASVPPELRPMLATIWSDQATDPLILRVACRMGSRDAYQRIVQLVSDESLSIPSRVALLRILADVGEADCVTPVLGIAQNVNADALRTAALAALSRFDQPQVARVVVSIYPRMNASLRTAARRLLFGRVDWTRVLLDSIDRGRIPAADVQPDELRRVALYNDPDLDGRIRKRWGNIRAGTPEEKLADIRRISNDLRAASGRADRGHELFKKNCATCHTLFGEGNRIGPDLTTANRKDRDYLLVSIVDPSVQIRKEYLAYVVTTNSGRVVSGLILDQSPSSITLVGPKNERTSIPRSEIEEINESPQSLMPERLLDPLKPEDLRDLFSYLQK